MLMNPPFQRQLHFLDNAALRISLSGVVVGSGIALSSADRTYVYVLTARHCLAQGNEPLPGINDISVEWYDSEYGIFSSPAISTEKGKYLECGDDLICIAVKQLNDTDALSALPSISIGHDLCNLNTPCLFRGFPLLTEHKPFTVQDQYVERLGVEFAIEGDHRFESNNSRLAEENTGAFSGSGVIMVHDEKTILIGIVLRYQANSRRFFCIGLQKLVGQLHQAGLPPISVETREQWETNPQVLKDIHRLRQVSARDEQKITDQIGMIQLPRKAVQDSLSQQLKEQQLLLVWGHPGRGKSAAVKHLLLEEREKGAEVLMLDALSAAALLDPLQPSSVQSTSKELWTSLTWMRPLVILIDGVEKLIDADRLESLFDILQTHKLNAAIKIVFTCRHYALNQLVLDLTYQLPPNFAKVEVPQLTEAEVQQIADEYPVLSQLLRNARLSNLLYTPFYLDLIVRHINLQSVGDELNEAELKQLLWKQVIVKQNVTRGQLFTSLVLSKARQMTPYVQVTERLDLVEMLCQHDILRHNDQNPDLVTPTHDIFEDWALSQFVQSTFQANQQPEAFFGQLGTAPAIRRAYRRWLIEIFEGTDIALQADVSVLVDKIINADLEERIWHDETLTSLLKSARSQAFWQLIPTEWFAQDKHQRLWKIISLLRTACQEPNEELIRSNPPTGLETPFQFYYLRPVGYGWEMVITQIYQHHHKLSEQYHYLLDFLLTAWQKKLPSGRELPAEASLVGQMLMECLAQFEEGSLDLTENERQGSLKLVFRLAPVITSEVERLINRASAAVLERDESKLTETNKRPAWELRKYYEEIIEYTLGYFYSAQVCKALPEVVCNIALKHWLSGGRGDHHSSRDHAYLYGVNGDLDDDYGQSSAYQTCVWHLLRHDPIHALGLIVGIVNFSVWAYERYCPDDLEEVSMNIDGVVYAQKGNYEYWAMYRGTVVTSDLIMSVLMAFECWLLEWAAEDDKIADSNLDFIYNYLLTKSKCIATTSVLASVAMAYPARIGARILPVLAVKSFYDWDSTRMTHDFTHSTYRDFKNPLVQPERNESNQLPHRRMRLEDLTNLLQREGYKDKIHAILDKLWQIDPTEAVWRLALKRMDLRHWEQKEIIEREGQQFVVVAPKLEEDLQAVVDEVQKDSILNTSSISAFLWAKGVFDGDSKYENTFEKWIEFHEMHKDDKSHSGDWINPVIARFSSAQEGLAAVGVRDYWNRISVEQRRWCIEILLQSSKSNSASHGSSGLLHGETLFVLPLMLNKAEMTKDELVLTRRLLFHSLVYQHDNNLIVPPLLQGVVDKLWKTDYDFAVSCVAGLCRLAYCNYVLYSDNYNSRHYRENRSRQLTYRELLITKVVNCKLKVKPNRVNRIVSECFYYLARALEMIDWSSAPADCVQLAQRCINLYVEHLRSDYSRENRWNHRERVNIRELMRMEDQVGRLLYELPTAVTQPLFRTLLETITMTNQPREVGQSIDRVFHKIIALEDSIKLGHLWSLWSELAKVIREHSTYRLLPFLFLRFNAQNDGWKETAEEWIPLQGKLNTYQNWFDEFGRHNVVATVRLMSDVGLKELTPSCLPWLSRILHTQSYSNQLKSALERLVQRAYYRHKQVLRNSQQYRDSFLVILNWLVEQNSPVAYELRDRFV